MSRTTRRVLIAFGLVFLGGVLAMLALPNGFRRLDMMSESDGRRQKDWIFFGFIPYSTTEFDASLHVSDDFRRELAASKLQVDPGFEAARPDFLIRNHYATSMTYYCRSTVEEKLADLIRLYARQLGVKSPRSTGTETFLSGTLPNGQAGQVQLWMKGPGRIPGFDKVEVVVELTLPK